MNIRINRQSVTPLYKQIKNGIRDLIRDEELTNGFKLPPERALADELGVHRNTVIRAYDELILEGLIVSSRTSPRGYFVLGSRQAKDEKVFFTLEKMIRYNFSSNEKVFERIFNQSSSGDIISLGGIVIDRQMMPLKRIGSVFERMKAGQWVETLNGTEDRETERLKENICRLLKKRNMYVNKRNVQIVSESTQALSYILDLYLKPGDCVIVEEPVVPDTMNLFRNKDIEAVGVSLEKDGPNLKELELLIINKRPKFLYIMPNYQNPSAGVISLEKRAALLEISHKYGIPIIEDDALREFSYAKNEIPSLYSLDQYKSVIYIDTFTLTTLPGIKTAFLVGPYEPVEMIGRYIVMSQVSISNIGQHMLNEFIESGQYEEHLAELKVFYKRKRDRLTAALEKIRGRGIDFEVPEGGLFIWCRLDDRINEKELFLTCRKKGLLIMPGYIFYPGGYRGGGHIRICFSNIEDDKIEEAVGILAEAVDAVMK